MDFSNWPLGVSVLDKHMGSDEPRRDGAMVITPPPDARLRAILAGEPITCRRIAMLEPSHYLSHEQTVAYASLFAAAPELLAACKAVVTWAAHANAICEPEDIRMLDTVRTAIAKAEGEQP